MFNLQGHRGARGLKPENTLPSFEAALDAGVTSIETDLHLTSDGQVVLAHDPTVAGRLIATLTRAQLAACSPIPSLQDFFTFVKEYVVRSDKPGDLRARAETVIFDLELKRVPGRPELIGAALEERVLDTIHRHSVLDRTVVRSFDHHCVRALKQREPRLRTAVLVAGTAPVAPEDLARQAGASIYCPDVNFLDQRQVRQLHAAGLAVLPWTVNDPAAWERLLEWGVDGITTDYPDRLAAMLRGRGVAY